MVGPTDASLHSDIVRARLTATPGKSMTEKYVHGYTPRENARLGHQADALVDLLHRGTSYPPGSLILEAGCGVGAQTLTLARNSPDAQFVSIDLSADSTAAAKAKADAAGLTNVQFRRADIFALPFASESFDHVFVCFLLEHLSRPIEALQVLKAQLKPGGTMTVIEGDHGSAYFHPDSDAARRAIQCQVELQRTAGGNALIGRELYPMLVEAGFARVRVWPLAVYVDGSRPDLVDGFTKKTFTAMVEGVRDTAIEAGLAEAEDFDAGIRALYRTAEADGVFCYTFFKAVGERPRRGGSHSGQHRHPVAYNRRREHSLAPQSENAEMRNKVPPKAAAVVVAGPGLTVRTSAGPYYITNTPPLVGGDLNSTGLPGDPIKIVGHVYSGTDIPKPIAGAKIEVWQADSDGVYHPSASGDMSQYSASEIALRGYVLTDGNGAYEFTTIYPGHYSGRTRHIHVRASAAGHGGVTTQIIVPPKVGDGTTPQNDMVSRYLPPASLVNFSDQNGVQSGTFDFYLAVD